MPHQAFDHRLLCLLQVALSGLVGILNNGAEVLSRVNASVIDGRSCKLVAGRHNVCFFPCMRYNYCHHDQSCCTDPTRLPVSLTSLDELLGTRVRVRAGPAAWNLLLTASSCFCCCCTIRALSAGLLGGTSNEVSPYPG